MEEQKAPEKKSRVGLAIGLLVLAVAIGGAVYWRVQSGKYESTDDAQVGAHLSAISSRVAGTVTAVYVEENQLVKAGDPIAELDARDFENALDQARGRQSASVAQVSASNPNVPMTETANQASVSGNEAEIANAQAAIAAAEESLAGAEADLREAEAKAAKAQADVARYQPLAAKDEVPRAQYDQVVATAKADAAAVDSKRAAVASARKTIDQRNAGLRQIQVKLRETQDNAPRRIALRRADIVAKQADVKISRTQVARAALDLSYTKIYAPVAGVVSRRTVEVGQRVNAGQQMVQIAQIGDLWVTANFKETQLKRINAGQRVTVYIDAFQQELKGHIESMPATTGSVNSLLPPENATGNYVKVVQRLPVRIRFEAGQAGLDRLRPGMSAEPKVWME